VLIGGETLPMATVGHDLGPYETWMQNCGLSLKHVARAESEFTAQADSTTDLDANQITAFHTGTMNHFAVNRVPADGSIQREVTCDWATTGRIGPYRRDQDCAPGHASVSLHACRIRGEFLPAIRRPLSLEGYSREGAS
jgi:hypothetical protein